MGKNKKAKKSEDKSSADSKTENKEEDYINQLAAKLPKEAQERLKNIKKTLDTFQQRVVEKFDKYIVGVALLPPTKPLPQQQNPTVNTQAPESKPESSANDINVQNRQQKDKHSYNT